MATQVVISTSPSDLVPAGSTAGVIERLAEFLRINVSAGDASEHTIRGYMTHVGQFAAWCRKQGIDPGRAAEHELALYRRALAEGGYARSTIAVKLSALRRFFQAAVWNGLRADNPAERLKPPREHTTRRDQILARYLSPEEVQRLTETIARDDSITGRRDHAITIEMMYRHGLRVSEVSALNLHDVKQRNRLHVIGSKGGKSRVILLVEKSLAALEVWQRARLQVANQRSGDAMFLSLSKAHYGARITVAGARWVVQQRLKAAGLYEPGIGPHALRHSHAAHAAAAGVDLHALMEELGHANMETTGVYLHVVDAVEQNPAEHL
jgi:integrase/recombinase XerD